jgi:hypothetical protein
MLIGNQHVRSLYDENELSSTILDGSAGLGICCVDEYSSS